MLIESLKDQGFKGFIRFSEILSEPVPTEHGVYAVVREGTLEPQFLTPGSGRKGSHYSLDLLRKAWVLDSELLYIGRAQCKLGIYERLNKYRRFGNGKNSGHSGGRAIWQLADAQELKVCWLVTGERDPVETESLLIETFKMNHDGQRPYANRIDGTGE